MIAIIIILPLIMASPVYGQSYPGDPSVYKNPPPLTEQEIQSPEFWRQEREAVLGRDQNGRNLHERGRYCREQEAKISKFAELAMEWVTEHDIWFSPSKGYIPHGVVMADQQTLRMYAEVGFRDMRYAKANGADTAKCTEIADFAVKRILDYLSRYPADDD